MLKPTQLAHQWVAAVLEHGDSAIDATGGNGFDAAFLAQQLQGGGSLHIFDVQQKALSATRARIEALSPAAECEVLYHLRGHEEISEVMETAGEAQIGAVMFNLGYLPHGDKEVTTRPQTTRTALSCALRVVRPGGIVTVVVYTGHPGGEDEARVVDTLIAALDPEEWEVASYQQQLRNAPPRLIVLEKKA